MNVFYTNLNPIQCAREHCTKHRNKMIIEYAQLLSTAHRQLDGECINIHKIVKKRVKLQDGSTVTRIKVKPLKWHTHSGDKLYTRFGLTFVESTEIYANTHINHPSAIWVRESVANYSYVFSMALELCNMYETATGRTHKTYSTLINLLQPPHNMSVKTFSEPPVAAPDKFKMLVVLGHSTEHAYQQYLISKFAEWQQRDKPIKVEFCCGDPSWYK